MTNRGQRASGRVAPGETRVRFHLALSSEAFLHYYRGTAGAVNVQAEDGRRIQLPASSLRPFVTHEGIRGWFEIAFDERNKLIELSRL